MTIKEAKENILNNFRSNYASDINTHDVSAHSIEVFLLNAMEQLVGLTRANIRTGLLKETTIGENTLNIFDEIIKKI